MSQSSTVASLRFGVMGFTRTELLVCLAVVTVIAAGAILSQNVVQDRHRLAVCTANLLQISRALALYAADHGDRFPDSSAPQTGDLWWWYKEKVKGYAGLSGVSSPKDTLFACPMDRGYSDPAPFCKTARFDYGSYVFNGVQIAGLPNIAGWKTASIRQPQQTLLVMEWTAHAPLSWHRSKTGRANAPFYSDAQSVTGFVDGHARISPIYYDGYNPAYTRDPIPGYDYQYSGK
jgi:hypothetical protein